jgi:hypothetical protein
MMRQRLTQITEKFGENRTPYAGTECGTWSFPTYQTAIEYLKRVAEATHKQTK